MSGVFNLGISRFSNCAERENGDFAEELNRAKARISSGSARAMRLNKAMRMVQVEPAAMSSLVFDFHATAAFDFLSAMYFFKARRFFCLLRLWEFFRASCFMLILLVRRN